MPEESCSSVCFVSLRQLKIYSQASLEFIIYVSRAGLELTVAFLSLPAECGDY